MSRFLFIGFVLFCQIIFGQTAVEKVIHGKIIAESKGVEGVTVVNLVNEKSTVSDGNGEFYILAKAEDLLVFSSVNLDYYRKIIEEEDLRQEVVIIKMTTKITELKEVIVNEYPEINAVSLGIVPKGIKHYTPAESKLYTATSGGGIDGLLNMLSGRTKMLKKELEVEKKQIMLAKIAILFDDKYYVQTLKIPPDYIKGFQYYCVDDANLTASLESKNKAMIMFLMTALAVKYNEIIHDEK